MKKYFMKETENEVKFGDTITCDFTVDLSNGKTRHHHLDCVFAPETVDMLLDYDVIKEEEIEDYEEEHYACDALLEDLIKENAALEERINKIEHKIKNVISLISNYMSELKPLIESISIKLNKPSKNGKKTA